MTLLEFADKHPLVAIIFGVPSMLFAFLIIGIALGIRIERLP